MPAGHKNMVKDVAITLTGSAACGAPGSGGSTGAGGAGGTAPGGGGTSGSGGSIVDGGEPEQPVDVGPAPETAPDVPVIAALPPSLTKCKRFDYGPMDCGPNLSPYQSVFAGYSPDGKHVVSAGLDDGIKFWTVKGADLEVEAQRLSPMGQARVAYSPDMAYLAVGADKGQLFLFDFAQGAQVPLMGHAERVRAVQFSKDGSRLYSVDMVGTLRAWDMATKMAVGAPITIPGVPYSLAVAQTNAPGETWVAVGLAVDESAAADAGAGLGKGGHVYLVNALDPDQTHHADHRRRHHHQPPNDGGHLPRRQAAGLGGASAVVKVWDISNRMMATKVYDAPAPALPNGEVQPVRAVAFSPDNRYVARRLRRLVPRQPRPHARCANEAGAQRSRAGDLAGLLDRLLAHRRQRGHRRGQLQQAAVLQGLKVGLSGSWIAS